ncbi:MAG: T9SS type A sorting domain-containing protein [Bacteroidetes bacterium]|nr:MAG: T9SS type A sorting domain-containing protein [Bacteroidota bacterium]
MKKSFFIFLCLLGISASSFSQWQWSQLSFAPAQGLYAVHCVNYDTVIAVGENGYIIRTTNSGVQWTSIPSNTSNALYKVSFVNIMIGYAVGANGTILKTTDNGQSWSNIGISTNMSLLSMSFLNKDTGWVAGGIIADIVAPYGNKGILLKTTNGGANWIVDSTYNKAVISVFLIDSDTGYTCTNSKPGTKFFSFLNKTKDAGNSFSVIKQDSVPGGYFTDVQFINPKTGYFVHFPVDSGIYKTTDYGNTWNNILSDRTIRNLFVIDSCSFYYSYAEMPGCGLRGKDICSGSNLAGINGSWVSASFVNKNKGFSVRQHLFCGNTDYTYKLDTMLVGIAEEKSTQIELFPNPFNNKTTLNLIPGVDISNMSIAVYNSTGQEIINTFIIKNNRLIVDLSNYPNGVYNLMAIDKNNHTQTIKLMKY